MACAPFVLLLLRLFGQGNGKTSPVLLGRGMAHGQTSGERGGVEVGLKRASWKVRARSCHACLLSSKEKVVFRGGGGHAF
jgi:hypothetical protein